MKKFKISKKYLLIGAAILGITGLIFWRKLANKPQYAEYTVSSDNIRETLELSGKVDAERSATLRFSAGGLVTYMGAKEGDAVKKGQTLASIDTRQLKKVLEQKLNLYAIQRGTFDQGQDDYEKEIKDGDVDKELRRILEKNQYQLDNTVKDVEYQDLSIQLSRITSPIQGILTHSPITVPSVQAAATDTWTVVDPESLVFTADLDETDLTKVKIGQKVIVTLDAFPDKSIDSTVSSISFAPVETTTGTTYRLKIKLPAAELADLRLGLNGSAAIVLQEKEAVQTLPSAAIKTENGSATVLVIKDGKYVSQKIETGIENEGVVEVVSGLGEGEHVFTQK